MTTGPLVQAEPQIASALESQWLFYSHKGLHERAARIDGEELLLTANETRSGAISRAWFPAIGWQFQMTLNSLTLPDTCMVICLYSGIEYVPHSYENRIEFEICDDGVNICAARRQFHTSRFPISFPAQIRIFCSLEGELTLIINDRPIHSLDQRILLDGAQPVLYAKGSGNAALSNILLENARESWLDAHPDAIPRQEFPNPMYRRDTWWESLNGDWEFAFDPFEEFDAAALANEPRLPLSIKVPFPWQSRFSGIRQPAYMGRAWYRRSFEIPSHATEPGQRMHLNFIASDFETRAWVNGNEIGEHKGSYSRFSFDITDFIYPDRENQILLMVEDPKNCSHIPIGKQGTWYTRSSGLWQSVFLQARHEHAIEDLRITPDIENSQVHVAGRLTAAPDSTSMRAYVSLKGQSIADTQLEVNGEWFHGTCPIPQAEFWSPDHPTLYDLKIEAFHDDLPGDALYTYFGMRRLSHDGRRLMLNNKPLYIFGALNQAFHPGGLYNYPDENTIRNDVIQAKALGFNLFRVHIKVDDPLLYYYMDTLGLLAWQDLPSLDDRGYIPSTDEENEQLNFPENSGKWNMVRDACNMVRDLYNHPSVVIWNIINEGWGLGGMFKEMPTDLDRSGERQAFLKRMYRLFHDLDSTRYVVDNSPCEQGYSHIKTDLLEYHFYANYIAHAKLMTYQEEYGPWRAMISGIGTREQINNWFSPSVHGELTDDDYNRPIIISEYGPWPGMPWHEQDTSVFLKFLTHQIMLNEQISGFVVTEYQDIEWERNGLVHYDRKPKKFGFDMSRVVFNPVIPLIDAPPFIHSSEESVELPLYVSNYGRTPLKEIQIESELHGVNPFGFGSEICDRERIQVKDLEFGLRDLGNVRVPLPGDYPLYWYSLRANDESNAFGRNVIFIENTKATRAAKDDPAAINLEQFTVEADRVEEFRLDDRLEVVGFYGMGRLLFWLPQESCPKALMMEISTCPDQLFLHAGTPEPAIIEVYFNETKIHQSVLPAARANFDGYMSQINSYRWGMFGDIVTLMFSLSQCKLNQTNRVVLRTPSNQGMVVYSSRAGRYPTPPLMLF